MENLHVYRHRLQEAKAGQPPQLRGAVEQSASATP
jgi:hypothetical protein